MQSAMAASERIFKLLDTPAEVVSPAVPKRAEGPGRIEFDHVWFAYHPDQFVLRDVSFTVTPGQRIGIVGATGSGKTTIVSLLLRFYDIQRGRILVNGVDIREWELTTLRGLFGVVLQDPHLFSGTIAENIRLGKAAIGNKQKETRHAARQDPRPGRPL